MSVQMKSEFCHKCKKPVKTGSTPNDKDITELRTCKYCQLAKHCNETCASANEYHSESLCKAIQ